MSARSRTAVAVVVALALTVLACASASSGRIASTDAEVAGIERVGKRQVDLTLSSSLVGREVRVRLLLPRRFDREPRRRWPVLYLLHGCCDTYESWTRSTDVERLSRREDVLVVMPEGGAVGFYSNWMRGPAWERFHLSELRGVLERRFRAGGRRAVAGLSMGGLGAMAYAARNPGVFRAAASYSGLLHTRLTAGDSGAVLGLVQSQGEKPLDLWGDPDEDAERWAAHNPYDLAERLRGVSLFVSSGNGRPGPLDAADTPPDQIEPNVLRQSTAFVERLQRLGIPARVDLYGNGTHSWAYWERELHRSWPMLMRAING
jgi:diacylglycerol O-acyltransferase / trehalose O-mycolyltransferase